MRAQLSLFIINGRGSADGDRWRTLPCISIDSWEVHVMNNLLENECSTQRKKQCVHLFTVRVMLLTQWMTQVSYCKGSIPPWTHKYRWTPLRPWWLTKSLNANNMNISENYCLGVAMGHSTAGYPFRPAGVSMHEVLSLPKNWLHALNSIFDNEQMGYFSTSE